MPVPGESIETISVYHHELKSMAQINKGDYDPKLHTLEEDYKAQQFADKIKANVEKPEGGGQTPPAGGIPPTPTPPVGGVAPPTT
jgi:hypothetical protein